MRNIFKFFIIGIISVFSICAYSQQKSDSKGDGKKLYGEGSVVTNYIEKGISQSDNSWALQAGFGYKMGPQARIGLWGSSVKFPTTGENVNLRPYFDVNINFTANSSAILKYELNRYFGDGPRNGSVFSIVINTFNYQVLIDTNDNWEGTGTGSTYFGFRKEFAIPWDFTFTPTGGYTRISADGYTNYFDTRMSLGYKFADLLAELVHTFNSSSSQFNGRGNMAILLALSVKF